MSDNQEVLIPIWVIKNKVELDYEEWMFFNDPKKLYDDNGGELVAIEDLEPLEPFPMYDSTIKCLEVLESNNIHFDSITGEWK